MLNPANLRIKHGRLFQLLLYAALSFLCNACALSESKNTYYQVIHEPALHAQMRTMANSLGILAFHFFEKKLNDDQMYNIVNTELRKIEQTASQIGGKDAITNYSVINRYMGAFLYDVGLAREAADQEPPNFSPAFRLIKSCQACHESM